MNWELIFKRNIAWNDLESLQRELIKKVQYQNELKYLLLSEPKPTFTHGRNSNSSDLLWTKDLIEQNQVQVAAVSRGGKWTYHGPGQILIYPIVHLPSLGYSSKEIRAFLEDFRSGAFHGLKELLCEDISFGEPFGLYIRERKLASFGLAFERGISSHGMALYLTDQSYYFRGITACGVSDGITTHLTENLNQKFSWDSVASLLAHRIKNHLSLRTSRVL